jgi:hypothetical protein
MIYTLLFAVLLFGCLANAFHLTRQQMYSIRGILMHPGATQYQKAKIQQILYSAYEKWAIKQAVVFKKNNKYKCRDASTSELVLASKFGLAQSSKNYNGRSAFVSYSEIYVNSELLKCMNNRLKGRKIGVIFNVEEMKSTEFGKKVEYSQDYETHILNNSYPYLDYCQGLNLDATTKRMMALKFDYETQTVRSNKHIAELMCCSEETVRLTLKNANKIV